MKRFAIRLLSTLVLFGSALAQASAPVPLLVLEDSVNAGMQLRLARALETARKSNAPAVFVELDTPGGYLEVTRQIVKDFLASKIPIIIYITPSGAHAASAGSMIAMAAHFAAMAPSTSIGAATPVSSGGEDIQGDMRRKVTNDTVAFVEGIAEQRGRDKKFAKESVTEAISLNATDAAKKNVVDGVYESRDAVWIAARIKFPDLPEVVTFEPLEMTLKERALSLLSNPNVAYGLMALGMMGLYMEVNSPGLIVPGIVGVASLALGSISMQIIPIQTSALVLLVLGLILLAIEVMTPLPTFGIAGLAALILFFLSGVFLMDETQGDLGLDPGLWLPVFVVATLAVAAMSYFAYKALRAVPVTNQGTKGMVGLEARITRIHSDSVSLAVIGEIWTGFPLDAKVADFAIDESVEIVSQEGLKVFFRKKKKE